MKICRFLFLSSLVFLLYNTQNVCGIAGDIDGSGRVDGRDLSFMALHYGEATNALNYTADLNSDGVINTNDFLILDQNFGKTDTGGAAVWVATVEGVYKLGIDKKNVISHITGFATQPYVNDINPDTGEAWIIPDASDYIYVISPFAPLEYNVSTDTGYHYTYHVPGIVSVSLSSGTNAALCTDTAVYYWFNYPQDYVYSNDLNHTHYKEFYGMGSVKDVKLFKNSHIWAKSIKVSSYYNYYRLDLDAPSVYDVRADSLYSAYKSLYIHDYNSVDAVDTRGNLIVKRNESLYKISPLSMGIIASRTGNKTINTFVLSPNDNSIWYSWRNERGLSHVSDTLNEVLLSKTVDTYTHVSAIDSNRKYIWAIGSYNTGGKDLVEVFNYLGNKVYSSRMPDLRAIRSLCLFLPQIFAGYPVAHIDADVTEGLYPLTVTFSAANSYDPDGTIIQYAWDFNGDGVYDITGTDATNVTHTFTAPGTYPIMMKVTDDDGLQNYDSSLVIGVGPLTVIPKVTPTNGVASLAVTFSATILDGLGDGTMENYQWDFDGDGVFDYVSLSTPDTTHTYTKAGDYDAHIKVLSSQGEIGEASVRIHAEEAIPTVSVSSYPSYLSTPGNVNFNVNFNDVDGVVTLINMDMNNDGIFEYSAVTNAHSGTQVVPFYISNIGDNEIHTFVVDNEGNHSFTNTYTVTYLPDEYALVLSPPAVNAVGSIICTTAPAVISTAPDTVRWTINSMNYSNASIGVYREEETTKTRLEITELNIPGTYDITLSDPSLQGYFTVYNSGKPVADIKVYPSEGSAPLAVSYDASESHSDAGITFYEWDFDAPYLYDDAEEDYNVFFGGITRSTDTAHNGTYSLQLAPRIACNTQFVPATDEGIMLLSIYGRVTNDTTQSVQVRIFYNDSYGSFVYDTYYMHCNNTWQKYVFTLDMENVKDGSEFFIALYNESYIPVYIDEFTVSRVGIDGDTDTTTSGPLTDHTFTTPGTYVSRLRITDTNGKKAYASRVITVTETPVIEITSPINGHTYSPYVTFTASVEHPEYIFAYYWDFNGDGIVDISETALTEHEYSFQSQGAKTTYLLAEMDNGNVVTSSVSFTVQNVSAPEIKSMHVSPLKARSAFYASTYLAVDFKESEMKYMLWQLNDGAVTTNTSISHSIYVSTIGVITQKITAIGRNGLSTSTQAFIRSLPYRSIMITAQATPNPTSVGEPVALDGTLYYQGGAVAEEFTWDFDSNGTIDWSSTNAPLTTHTYMNAGSVTSTVSVTTTNGAVDFDATVVTVLDTIPTSIVERSTVLVNTDYEQTTNFALIGSDKVLLSTLTNFYGQVYQCERSIYNGSFYVRTHLGYPYYEGRLVHFDSSMNIIAVLSPTAEYAFNQDNLFSPCIDSDCVWMSQKDFDYPYHFNLIQYSSTFSILNCISNLTDISTVRDLCALPNNRIGISYRNYSTGEKFVIYSADGTITASISPPLEFTEVLYNPVSTTLWMSSYNGIFIYSEECDFVTIVPTRSASKLTLNPVDGTVVCHDYNSVINRYDAYGNHIFSSPSSEFSNNLDVNVSDGHVFLSRSYYVRGYAPNYANYDEYTSIPFANYSRLAVGGPYYTTYAYGSRPTIKGSYTIAGSGETTTIACDINAWSPVGIKNYQWDFDGDGVYDYYSETTGTVQHEYTTSGTYAPVCRITDNNGVAIADTHLPPVTANVREAPVIPHLYLTPATMVTAPVNIAMAAYVENGTPQNIRIYANDIRIAYSYNPVNPTIFNVPFNIAGEYTIRAEITVDSVTYTTKKNIIFYSPSPIPVITYSADRFSAPSHIILDASTSYAPGSSLQYIQWDINNDGFFDIYFKDITQKTSLTFPTQATATVVLRAVNKEGVYADTNVTITITNSGPVATLSAIPSRGVPPFTSTLAFSAEDPDGTIVVYRLDADGNGTIDYTSSTPGTYQHTYTNTTGTRVPRVYVVDSQSVTGVAQTTVSLLAAGTPIALASASPHQGDPPLTVTLTGMCTNQPVALYEWDLDGDGTYEWNSTTTGTLEYEYDSKGKVTPSFRVTATNGMSDTAQITLFIGAFPISQPRAMPLQATAPQEVKFTADGIDPDGTILYFYWDFNNSGSFVSYNPITDTPSTYTYLTPGSYTTHLIAQDDSGLQNTGSVTVTVIEQTMPQATAYASPDIVQTGEVVHFYGYAYDEDGTISQMKWLFGDGAQNTSTLDGRAAHSYSSTGVFTALYIVTDNDGNSATATVFVSVLQYGWPEITGSVTPTAGDVPLTVSFSISGTAVSAPITSYAIDFGDGTDPFTATSAGTVSHTYTDAGTYTAVLRVTDTAGHTSSRSLIVRVGGNMSVVFNREKCDPTLGQTVTARVFLPFAAAVTLNVQNQYGIVKKTLLSEQTLPAGVSEVIWDGTDTGGNYVQDGTYYFVGTYKKDGYTYVYDPSYDVPGLSSPTIDQSTVLNKKFNLFRDNPLMIGFTLNYRSEMSLYMAKNPSGNNVTPYLYDRVKTIYHRTPLASGTQYARWDTTDDNGEIAVDPFSAADFYFYIWNWQLPVNSVIIDAKPKIADITIEGEPNYYSAGLNPYRDSVTNTLGITYSVSKPVDKVYIDIMKFNGQKVRSMTFSSINKGTHRVTWDAKADNGYLTTPGAYKLAIKAEDAEGNMSDTVYDLFKLFY